MLYKKQLGITGVEAKIALKTLHVLIGYVFVSNILIRLFFSYSGDKYLSIKAFIPGKDYVADLNRYLQSVKEGKPQQYVGHNPLGRLAITVMYGLFLIIAVSGLIRAGTDIYYPPFGSFVSQYVAQEGGDSSSLIPYSSVGINDAKMTQLKEFKAPIGKIHIYSAFLLIFIVILHVFKVVHSEIKEKSGLISAMFSGAKILTQKPVDLDKN